MPDHDIVERYRPLFMPRSVAVAGVSAKGAGRQNVFIRRLRALGYGGAIYPIHPSAAEIDGMRAYPSLAALPEPVDYACIAVPAAQIADMLAAAPGRVRYAQVISSGFGETEDGKALEERLAVAARSAGMRLIGPNCLGLYSPRGRITFTELGDYPAGGVGIVSQSGGLGTDILRRGIVRGVRYSGVVTVGNCADLGCSDLLEYYLADPDTQVIGLYIETAKDARRIFDLLRAAQARKPVVILKGGRTREGAEAASSHTGSLAGDDKAWVALSRQTGALLVDSLDELVDALLVFQMLVPRPHHPTERVVLFGNGGGASVLATDAYSRLGLKVTPFERRAVDALAALGLPPGTSITNPVDCPGGTLQQQDGRIAESVLDAIFNFGEPDALVMHLNMTVFVGRKPSVLDNLMQAALRVQTRHPGKAHFVLVLRSDGESQLDNLKREFRDKAIVLGIPVYDELNEAGRALAALRARECFLQARRG